MKWHAAGTCQFNHTYNSHLSFFLSLSMTTLSIHLSSLLRHYRWNEALDIVTHNPEALDHGSPLHCALNPMMTMGQGRYVVLLLY
jgi:hypothetical protein